jgi:hypoxanthine phosphoribosyltransferase
MSDTKIFRSWDMLDSCICRIVGQIKLSGKQYDYVYGIPRGGLVVAVMLSHKLNIPLFLAEGWENITDEEILVVDDVADSGKTLSMYKSYDIAVVDWKHNISIVRPTYYANMIGDVWVVYPWETMKTSKRDYDGS